jgi:multidrug efflux pump subunit AcrB
MSTRFQIAAMIFMMVNAVVFGAGIVPVLMIPSLANNAFEMIPAVVIASFVVSAPLSWFIAPRLRARYWRTQSRQGRLESTSQ